MRMLLAIFALASLGTRVSLAQELPPPFPRAGTTKMLENDRVVVWNISWLKQAYPQHRHPYDMTGVYYASGDRIIISPEGDRRSSHTEAWNITFQRTGLTHAEEGASDDPLRSVFIEMKQPPNGPMEVTRGPAVFPIGSPVQRLDNDRVTVWEYGPPDPLEERPHLHPNEAVVVSFDPNGGPVARYVARGSLHDIDAIPGSTRTFVFEIK